MDERQDLDGEADLDALGTSGDRRADDEGRGQNRALLLEVQLGQQAWDGLILDEIDRARAGGAQTLATIYHGCQRLICGFETERPITIEHYLSVFARGLGIEFEDRYKKFRLWQDPERVLEESTPCQTANHVDPARARQLVEKTFGRITVTPDGRTGAAS